MSESKAETTRKKFEVEIEQPIEFGAIASTKYITSNKFCAMVSELLKQVFCQYEGCIFEVNQGMEPTISLIFNHGEYPTENNNFAIEKVGASNVGYSVIDRGRTRDQLIKDGDRYYLTEDGKDFVKSLLIKRVYNNGNPDYRKVVSEFTDRGPINSYFAQQQNPQYTKVSFISIERLCSLLFGAKDKDGNSVEYAAVVAAPIPGYNGINGNTNYVLNIQQIDSKELTDFYNDIGLGTNNINIIR